MGNSAPKKSVVRSKRKSTVSSEDKKENSTLALAPMRSLLIRLEPRVPMVVQQFGLAILLIGIGTLASTLYLQSSMPTTLSQVAQIYGSATSTPDSPSTTEGSNTVIIPKIVFEFPSVMTTIHPLNIQASAGTKMQAFIQSKTTGLEKSLSLKSSSPTTGTWKFEVDVRGLPAGEYRFLSRTFNNDIWYDETSGPVTVSPTISEQSISGDSSSTTSSQTTESGETVSAEVSFDPLPSQVSGQLAITLQATGVSGLKVIVRSSDNRVVAEIPPSSVDGTKYTFLLDTKRYSDGEYDLEAKFYDSNSVDYISGPTLKFVNGVTMSPISGTTTTTASTTINATASSTIENKFEVKNITSNKYERYQMFEFKGNDLTFIEVHTKSQAQTSPVFAGLALRQSDQVWRYTIDSAELPRGLYQLVTKYKRFDNVTTYVGPTFEVAYGAPVAGEPIPSTSIPTPIQESVKLITPVVEEAQTQIVKVPVPQTQYQPAPTNVLTNPPVPTVAVAPQRNELPKSSQDQIDSVINQYTAALRSGDTKAIEQAKNRALSLGVELSVEVNGDSRDAGDDQINNYMTDLINRADRIESIVKERTEDKISQDTDGDGITDYDEITIYKSNPTLADTDGDGFNDGAEILAGFNPLSSETEVALVYESPKESGIARPDVLSVESVVAISESTPKEDGVAAQAEISGKGLPNSFVTLFIFSTPVVVTLKTGDDGSWMYTFDKELEDGEHEVYVGVTDNAGVIVAKSNPFRFVKEAQAFTPADELADSFTQEPAPQGIESSLWQAAIFGLIVFIVGLILILLGQQLEHSKKAKIISES